VQQRQRIDKGEKRRRWFAVAGGLAFGAISTTVFFADGGGFTWYGLGGGVVSAVAFGFTSYFGAKAGILWRR
jgi:hypothetical protein